MTDSEMIAVLGVAIPLSAVFAVLSIMADSVCSIARDVRRFVDACDENERKARGR